jgi:adenylate cyclase
VTTEDDVEGSAGALDALVKWFVFETPTSATSVELLQGFAERLCAMGLDLLRIVVQARPLSPQASTLLHVWRPVEREMELNPLARVVAQQDHALDATRVQVVALGHGAFETAAFRESPFYEVMRSGGQDVRRRITPAQRDFDFPILKDLHAQSATDYIALPLSFYGSAPSAISFATRKPAGFSDRDVTVLRAACRPLVLALSPRLEAHSTRTLLGAYLGPKTADRVLAGAVQRGDVQEIEAAIWFSDLRGFTPMSAGIPSSELITWLNGYFEAVGRAIVRHDGEILKFIGDAILAVWPVSAERPRDATCKAALAAAKAANAELDALNATRAKSGLAALEHGIGLHVGRAQYGNVGAEGRLDFTVIGPAVNTASRLESVCSKLTRRVIASADFAECGDSSLLPVGAVELKGVSGAQSVFSIAD